MFVQGFGIRILPSYVDAIRGVYAARGTRDLDLVVHVHSVPDVLKSAVLAATNVLEGGRR